MEVPEQSVPDGLQYHFNVIYNCSRSIHSETDDTKLSLEVAEFVVENAAQRGFKSAYYHDRDCLPGKNLFAQLLEVIKLSQYSFIILTPGFVRDCWARYCQMTAFKMLLEKDRADSLIPLAVNLPEESCPEELTIKNVVWLARDWRNDARNWNRVFRVLTEKIPVQRTLEQDVNPIFPIEETHYNTASPSNEASRTASRGNAALGGIQTTRTARNENVNLSSIAIPSPGALDTMDGPSPDLQAAGAAAAAAAARHHPPQLPLSSLQTYDDRERYSSLSLFGDGAARGGDRMGQRREQDLDVIDGRDRQAATAGNGLAGQRAEAQNSRAVPPTDVGLPGSRSTTVPTARGGNSTGRAVAQTSRAVPPTDVGLPGSHSTTVPTARGGNSAGRDDITPSVVESLERELGLTSGYSAESLQRAGSSSGSSSSWSAQDLHREPSHHDHQRHSGLRQPGEGETLPSTDGVPHGTGASPSPGSPPAPTPPGGPCTSAPGAGVTPARPRDPILGPLHAASSSQNSAATPRGLPVLSDEEQTFRKSEVSLVVESPGTVHSVPMSPGESVVLHGQRRVPEAERDAGHQSSGFSSQPSVDIQQARRNVARSRFAGTTQHDSGSDQNVTNENYRHTSSSSAPGATASQIGRVRPEVVGSETVDARDLEEDAMKATEGEGSTCAGLDSSRGTQAADNTEKRPVEETANEEEIQQLPRDDKQSTPSSLLPTVFTWMCRAVRPDMPSF